MARTVRLTDSKEDLRLIKQISAYQKKNSLPSFVAAVRKLCKDALALKELVR